MNSAPIVEALESALPAWLPGQRWFSSDEAAPSKAQVIDSDWVVDAYPGLFWTLVQVDGGATYQIPVGVRKEADIEGTLLGHGQALVGRTTIDGEDVLLYDGLIDSTLTKLLYKELSADSDEVQTCRPIGAEQSNTSLVYDERVIAKIFRRLSKGANPDLEVTSKLSDAGFPHVAPVLGLWQRDGWDLAVAQPYLYDGADGWSLALTSVRDFLRSDIVSSSSSVGSPAEHLGDPDAPRDAGGNFGEEARRLGEATGGLHVALSESFVVDEFDPEVLAVSLSAALSTLEGSERDKLQSLIDEVRAIPAGAAGKSTRVHGDYHFGQTLRSTSGWYIFDFEGEPARPMEERVKPTSPLKDVAGMLRSFNYASATGISEQVTSMQGDLAPRAAAWEHYNTAKFRQGYFDVEGLAALMPADDATRDLILRGFEVEKALYELAYEKAYRPDWISIPHNALRRLLA